MEEEKRQRLINELILYYWIDLQPTDEVDTLISEYLAETKQGTKKLVKNVNKYGGRQQ